MVKLQAALMIQGMAHRFSAQGIRLQDVYPDPSELKQETIASSERTLRQTLLIEAVAKLSGIEASEEDLEREIEAMAKRYNLAMETVRKGLEEKNKIEEVKFTALEKKVFDHIIANSHVTEEIERMEEASV
jgi:trigger factor